MAHVAENEKIPFDDIKPPLRAAGTLRGYLRLIRAFERWCAKAELCPMPAMPETIGRYLCEMAPFYRTNTIRNIVTALTFAHRHRGFTFNLAAIDPVMNGIIRVHGRPQMKSKPLNLDTIVALADGLPTTSRGLRDRALLLLGFFGAFRAEEIAGIDFAQRGDDALGFLALRSDMACVEMQYPATAVTKARRLTKFFPRGLAPCVASAVEHWVVDSGINGGPLFRRIDRWGHIGPKRIRRNAPNLIIKRIIKEQAIARGKSETNATKAANEYTFRSLRIGLIAAALDAGMTDERIAMQIGWTTTQMIEFYRRQQISIRQHPVRTVMSPQG
jgi:hypothetical protein